MTRPHSTSSATGKLYLSLSAAWTSEREKCYLTVLASAVHLKLTTKMRRGCASVLRTNSSQANSGPKLPISSVQADFVLQIQGTSGREEKVKVPQAAQAQINPALPEPTIPHIVLNSRCLGATRHRKIKSAAVCSCHGMHMPGLSGRCTRSHVQPASVKVLQSLTEPEALLFRPEKEGRET